MMCVIYTCPSPNHRHYSPRRHARTGARAGQRAKKLSAHLHDDERKKNGSGVCITEDEDAGPEDAAVLLALSAIGAAV